MNYIIFTQAQAHDWGWKPKAGDEYYSLEAGEWKPHALWGDGSFEVEALNRRPEHSVTTDLLVRLQAIHLHVERLKLENDGIRQELRIINPLG